MADVLRPPTSKTGPRPRKTAGPAAIRSAPADSAWLLLLAVVGLLCVIGLMMVLSASSVEAFRMNGQAWVVFLKQAMWVAIGAVALFLAAMVDYRILRRLVRPLLVVSFVALVVVLVPGVGIAVSGSRRWLGTEAFRIQPSEMAKFAVLIFAADLLARRSDQRDDFRRTARPLLMVTGLAAVLILSEPDMGTAMVLLVIVMTILFSSGMPLKPMVTVGMATLLMAGAFAMSADYRRSRMLSFLRPFDDASNGGYQVAQSLVALGTGHLTGLGLGAGRAKWGFLPNAHTDFIFAILGEELGLLGTLLVVGLFVVFAVLGIRTALRAPDRFGVLLATGVTAWVVGQALINMGAVTSLLPVTGVPLPFVSFGGSALVVTMGATGVLVNVARQGCGSAPRASRAGIPS